MPANKIQLQEALHKPYDRVLFSREVLSPVFGSGLTINSSLVQPADIPTQTELAVIDKVWIYGSIKLDDGTEVTCYEVQLQPTVRIEQSRVAIQQYVRKLLTARQAALINFIAPANKNVWRLTLVAKDSMITEKGVEDKITNAKRFTFLLGPAESCKTAAERFELLSTEKKITFQALLNAFSVEKLSEAFFDEYTLHYQNFCNYLQESNYRKSVFNITFPDNATKEEKEKACKPIRDFVKKLMGRIVFLYFVQKKGWLGASNTDYTDGMRDFIKQLFHQSGGNDAFYSNWLTVLFFDTLNKERPNDDFIMPDGKTVKVPFLNGGLFDKEEFDEHLLTFPAQLFHNPNFEDTILTAKNNGHARGFLDFLDAYNFTVYEDSPDDQTVAVDPEMLGHIFENLLEDNKDKGAFYTPKEIVHYMCQESLIEYLKTSLSLEQYHATSDAALKSLPLEKYQATSDGTLKSPPLDELQAASNGLPKSPPLDELQTASNGLPKSPPVDELQAASNGLPKSPPVDELQAASNGLPKSPPLEGCPKDGVVKRNSQNYFSLPYNPALKERARELRKAGNLPEILFWNRVKNGQFKGLDFDRQKIIGNYIVDFYCGNCNVVIEIDGSSHDDKVEYDAERDAYLESLGLTVIHIPVKDIMRNLEGVMRMLYAHPALKGSPPQEEEPPRSSTTPPQEEEPPRSSTTPPQEEEPPRSSTTPPQEEEPPRSSTTPPQEEEPPRSSTTPPQEGNWEEVVTRLVKHKDTSLLKLHEAELINKALDKVKICDPAIGSGAFPMGLLQEIYSIKELIAYKTGKPWNPAQTKLNIIQNSIYGVDIEKGAVDIARLRFWLSLVVDEEKPTPLPNLDYKIVVGDSLISKFDGEIVEIDWEIKEGIQTEMFGNENLQKRKQLLQILTEKQQTYFDPRNKNKKALALEIRNCKIDVLINQLELMVKKEGLEQMPIKTNFKDNKKFLAAHELYLKTQGWIKTIHKLKDLKQHPEKPFNHFDWKLDFPEVLNPYLVPDENQRGFDIVIGNPPWGAEISEEQFLKNRLKIRSSTDSSEYFILKSFDTFSKNKTIITFIVPKSILFANAWHKSRESILNRQIISLGDAGISFAEVNLESVIFILQNTTYKPSNYVKIVKFEPLKKFSTNKTLVELNKVDQKVMKNTSILIVSDIPPLAQKIIEKIQKTESFLKDFEREVFRGLYIPDKLKENILNKGEYKYVNKVPHVSLYSIDKIHRIDLSMHLKKFGNIIEKLQRDRIIIKVLRGSKLTCAYATKDVLTTEKLVNLIVNPKVLNPYYVLSLLNSNLTSFYLGKVLFSDITETSRVMDDCYLSKVPIKRISLTEQIPFINLVEQILTAKKSNPKADTSSLEQQIDNLVYRLYDLTYDEVKVIDPDFPLSRQEYEAIRLE